MSEWEGGDEGMTQLTSWAGQHVMNIVRDFKLPVIDLSRTFDPAEKEDYSASSPIEPSNKSGMYIANLVKFVIDNHDWGKVSKLYYGKGSVPTVDVNTEEYKIEYGTPLPPMSPEAKRAAQI